MSILLERGKRSNHFTETWLCDSEADIQDLPITIPPGSFVLIPTDDGLIIQIKNNKGAWKPVINNTTNHFSEWLQIQVEQDRTILESEGAEKTIYFIPKTTSKPQDGYDEFIYVNNSWENIGSTDIDLSQYALKSEIPTKTSDLQNDSGFLTQHQDISNKADKATTLAGYGIQDAYTKAQVDNLIVPAEIYIGEETPSGEEVLWIDTGDDSTPSVNGTVFGVVWDYSLSSPQLVRLTPQTDPLGVVTTVPEQEPTVCVGNDGNGQSEFDNYFPWKGMQRYNYVNGEIVDFVSYENGETYVYIPEFWSKIIDDSEESKMYIYISDSELENFTKHLGSGRYMSRYECNSNFLSAPGTTPKVNTNLGGFRTGITAIDNKHYQYDIHTYAALELLYIVEFAHLDTQSKIGAGITSSSAALTIGETDILTYHTGRVDGTADNVSAVQYRWIENLFGNVWNWVDGILIQDGLVYICNDRTKYASSITNDYESTGLYTPNDSGWHKIDQDYNNCYLIPLTTGSSNSTYTCDYYYYNSGVRGLYVGSHYGGSSLAGLFYWAGNGDPDNPSATVGGRAVLILNDGGN